jgi:hypothetical protein
MSYFNCNKYNFDVFCGDSFVTYLSVTDSNNNPLNLSGYFSTGNILPIYTSTGSYPLYTYISNPISGQIMVSGNSSFSSGLLPDSYVYNIQIYNNQGYGLTVLNGDFNVYPSTNYPASTYIGGN